jgi:hypothetical protein
MALLPEIHVNFDQVTYERVYQLFLPLIPGSTLVGGLVLAHPDRASAIVAVLGLGRYSRIAALVCCVYIVGLILYGFSMAVTGGVSLLVPWFLNKIKRPFPTRPNAVSAKSTVWRRVAAEFLGTLTPLPSAMFVPPTIANDVEWQDFYNVLQDYILRERPLLSNELIQFLTNLQAASWALTYLYWKTALRGHWSVMVVSFVLILFAATFPFVLNTFYWKWDRMTAWEFTARLINEIKMRQK